MILLGNVCPKCKQEKPKYHGRMCRECKYLSSKLNRLQNQEAYKETQKTYYIKNKEKIIEKTKNWQKRNPQKRKESKARYDASIKGKLAKKRWLAKSEARIRHRVRDLINKSIKKTGYSKDTKTHEILGLSFEEIYRYLELTYLNRYGAAPTWSLCEIDHIIPLATAQTYQEVVKLNHYTNLQLLLKKDNREKGAKLDWKFSDKALSEGLVDEVLGD